MDYRNIGWSHPVPGPGALDRDWSRTAVTAVESIDSRLVVVADRFRAMLDDDNVQLAQFLIDAGPAIASAIWSNRWLDLEILRRLFSHPVVRTALPAVPDSGITVDSFEYIGGFEGLGLLADRLKEGGAYVDFHGSDNDAFELASDFIRAVCDLRCSEIVTFFTRHAWTDWFHAVGPDASFLWFDKRSGIATVLLLTGTD